MTTPIVLPPIRSYAFYGNSLSLTRTEVEEGATAQGHYETQHGTVHLYGENLGPTDASQGKRRQFFSFYFTYKGRTYSCYFPEWLTDATIRRRALAFVSQVLDMRAHGIQHT